MWSPNEKTRHRLFRASRQHVMCACALYLSHNQALTRIDRVGVGSINTSAHALHPCASHLLTMKINPMPSQTYRCASALLTAALVSFFASGCLLTFPSEQEGGSFRPPISDMSEDNNDDNNDNNDNEDMGSDMPTPDMGMDMGQDMTEEPTCFPGCTVDQACEVVGGDAMCVCDDTTSTPDGDGGCNCKDGYTRRGIGGACDIAISCKDVPQLLGPNDSNPPRADGFYPLVYNKEKPREFWIAWCADVDTADPKTYLPLQNTGLDVNTFEFRGDLDYNSADSSWDLVRTSYYMIRIDPEDSFRVDIQDRRFARTTIRIGDEQRIEKEPTNLRDALESGGVNFGTISTCTSSADAQATIDLTGTGFKLAQFFKRYGNCPSAATTQERDAQGVTLEIKAAAAIEQPNDDMISMMSGNPPRPSCTSYGPSGMQDVYGIQTPSNAGACAESAIQSTAAKPVNGVLEDGYILRLAPDLENIPIPSTSDPMRAFNSLLPKSCMEAYALSRGKMSPVMTDSEQTLYINRDSSKSWRASCVTNGNNQYPVDYLVFDPDDTNLGDGANVFTSDRGAGSISTHYEGVRIDPHTLTVDINDQGMIDENLSNVGEDVPYATSERWGDFAGMEETEGQVDLSATSFDITEDEAGAWEPFGTCGTDVPAPVTGSDDGKYNVLIIDAESPADGVAIGLAPLRHAYRTPLDCSAADGFDGREEIAHIDPDNEDASYTLQLDWRTRTTAPSN